MGHIYADIEIINAGDLVSVRRGYMDKDEIRSLGVNVLVDTGSAELAINENIQEIMQLQVLGKRRSVLANGERIMCDVVGPVEVRFKNRRTTCDALVLPGDSEPLLGVIPMESMDVVINPLRQELTVNPEHPDYAVAKLPYMRTIEWL